MVQRGLLTKEILLKRLWVEKWYKNVYIINCDNNGLYIYVIQK